MRKVTSGVVLMTREVLSPIYLGLEGIRKKINKISLLKKRFRGLEALLS